MVVSLWTPYKQPCHISGRQFETEGSGSIKAYGKKKVDTQAASSARAADETVPI